MKSSEFRAELVKVMPGYKWTIHRPISDFFLEVTGIQTAGFTRTSTLEVCREDIKGAVSYCVKSSGYGKNSPWLEECTRRTLKQALRGLQNTYKYKSSNYSRHARDIEAGRHKENNQE